ncbi:MAG: hypothetical protein QY322_01035 [bacterium]|nr:MAG: hypothetical protein QY322_01035 [bacterium]
MTEVTESKIDIATAAQGEAITRPAVDTNIGSRVEKLNDELKNGAQFKKLKQEAFLKGWTPAQLDAKVRELGIR